MRKKVKQPSPNSYWVQPGQFAGGEYPGDRNPQFAAQKLEKLLDAGIDHFINLTKPGELAPYAAMAKQTASSPDRQVGWERHAIRDLSVPQNPEQMTLILDAMTMRWTKERPCTSTAGEAWDERERSSAAGS